LRVDPGFHDFASLGNVDTDIDFLCSHGGYRGVQSVCIGRLLSVSRVVGNGMVRRQGDVKYFDGVLSERISAYKEICYFPIILKVEVREEFECLGAGGERVCLELVVQEGGVLLPYFVCLVDAIQTIIFCLDHLIFINLHIKVRLASKRKIYVSRRKHFSGLLQLLIYLLQRKFPTEAYIP